jgi:hypothetical protein
MRNFRFRPWQLSIVLLLCLAPFALADNTASMVLTGAGNNALGGVMIGPYYATANGVPIAVICDDFETDSYVNQTWTANVYDFTDLSKTKFYSNDPAGQAKFTQAAWLTLPLLDPNVVCPAGGNCRGDIQFALWQLNDPLNPINGRLSGVDKVNALWWLAQSKTATLSSDQLASMVIYTPQLGVPQEFLSVRMDESPAPLLLGFNLLALLGLVIVFRHRLSGVRS